MQISIFTVIVIVCGFWFSWYLSADFTFCGYCVQISASVVTIFCPVLSENISFHGNVSRVLSQFVPYDVFGLVYMILYIKCCVMN